MASVGAKIGLVMPMVAPAAVGALGFALWRIDWAGLAGALFASEGRTTRLVVIASVLLNLKCCLWHGLCVVSRVRNCDECPRKHLPGCFG